MSIGTADHEAGTRGVPWGDVALSAIASVSWALIGMAGTAALGLHLLGADSAGSLGPMTAAVVALGANGAVKPSGDVSAFGLKGAEAHTAIEITPLGVALVGALLLAWFFLRSLRGAQVVIAPSELLARVASVVVLFVAALGGLAWAGHDVVTIDGSKLGLDRVAGGGGLGDITDKLPGGLGDLGGLLPDKIGDLVDAKAAVGFTVDTGPTLLGGAAWAAGVLVIALLASRRTPLPRGWEAVHRVVRPAASALVTVLLVAVLAGLAAAAYAAIGDDHPKRIAGAALLGAPNGVWLGVPVGLFVPWDGRATGELAKLLPDPLDRLLSVDSGRPVTLGRLAELDGRVWLLGVATALMMLFAGVLTATRTPFVREPGAADAGGTAAADVRGGGALSFAGRCALPLAVVTAAALPLMAWLTEVSADASLSVLGFDAFGAGIELHGRLGIALLLGAAWGAGAGAAGALLAYASGAAGRRAGPLALGDFGGHPVAAAEYAVPAGESGPYRPQASYRPPNPDTNPYLQLPEELRRPGGARERGPAPGTAPGRDGQRSRGAGPRDGGQTSRGAGPRGGGPPSEGTRSPGSGPAPGDVYGAPTVVGPIGAPPPRRPRSGGQGLGGAPPPPPPPPPDEGTPPPRRPRGGR
ncbi:streptophobe family protein [Streptomyces sp. 142MFCol3.1]|uniref:streptophobe family protein n=1 Tax=Streptomyces sp. 142MFCol3.1 TaxID=1172179 RepID=UPI000687056C|nr:streptophobe family protein [Streptomyces sp. 142MFCol3.1]